MGDLSTNFDRSEFKCKCGECEADTVDAKLLEILEKVRSHWGERITVTSGHRCEKYNEEVGGSPNSQHLVGRAADIVVDNKTPHQVYRLLEDWFPYHYGLGSYDDFTHFDTRNKRSRWKG